MTPKASCLQRCCFPYLQYHQHLWNQCICLCLLSNLDIPPVLLHHFVPTCELASHSDSINSSCIDWVQPHCHIDGLLYRALVLLSQRGSSTILPLSSTVKLTVICFLYDTIQNFAQPVFLLVSSISRQQRLSQEYDHTYTQTHSHR
jgi:hypothetical protein